MLDLRLTSRPAIERGSWAHRQVRRGAPSFTLALRPPAALASVIVKLGRLEDFSLKVRSDFGVDLPASARRAHAGPVAFIWAGPSQWLVIAEGQSGPGLERQLQDAMKDTAAVNDQSGGRAVVRVGGASAREVLAKGLPIDLHPTVFGVGDVALTTVAHMGVHFWQVDAEPTYEFAVSRSFAAAFWSWLLEASSSFGTVVSEPG